MFYSFEELTTRILTEAGTTRRLRSTKKYEEVYNHLCGVFKDLSEKDTYARLYKAHLDLKVLLNNHRKLDTLEHEGMDYYIVALNDVYLKVKETFVVSKPVFPITKLNSGRGVHPSIMGVKFGREYPKTYFNNEAYYFVGAVSAFDYDAMVALNKAYKMFINAYHEAKILITDPARYFMYSGFVTPLDGYGVWVTSPPMGTVGNFYAEQFVNFMTVQLAG